MKFLEYPKMPDNSSKWKEDLNKIGTFACFEKVHGSNFCVRVDTAGEVSFATRRRVLPDDENFFAFRSTGLEGKLAEKAKVLFGYLKPLGATGVAIFGELCGGRYLDQPTPPEVVQVQMGVEYCPSLEYLPFDVAIAKEDGSWGFLDVLDTIRLCSLVGFIPIPSVYQGKFADCAAFPLGFDSKVPELLGLIPPPAGTNKAEGVVVRLITNDGAWALKWPSPKDKEEEKVESEAEGVDAAERSAPIALVERSEKKARMLFKRKIPEFNEVSYITRRKPKTKQQGPGPAGTDAEAREMAALAWTEGIASVTPARLQAAISKVGQLTRDADRWRDVSCNPVISFDIEWSA